MQEAVGRNLSLNYLIENYLTDACYRGTPRRWTWD